jgi:beta-lactamase regulating signal transducer with metallopeptidase domain
MIASWMLYALLVGAMLAGAAAALESLCRLAGRPTRWVWSGALLAAVALTALAPWRASRPDAAPLPLPLRSAMVEGAAREAGVAGRLASAVRIALADARAAVARGPARLLAAVERRSPPWLEQSVAVVWPVATALLLSLLAAVHLRYRRARRGWPRAELQGVAVRISPEAGPAVVGLARPEIVVPRWLLQRAPEEQRLVLAHEREHVRAGDAALLAAAWTAVALLPWHPAAWWMLARLRLAVELDCDARVLRRGAPPRSYGALLIDIAGLSGLAGHRSGLRLGAPALADEPSHLERRLIAMTSRRPRFAAARGATLAALALGATLAACEAALPTAAEVDRMDAASATDRAQRMKVLSEDDSLTSFTIDGEAATAEQANLLAPEQIAAVEVVRKDGRGEVRITTRARAEATGMPMPEDGTRFKVRITDPPSGSPEVAFESKEREFTGLIFIDGVKADQAAMRALSPDRIESVEVIKGPAATQRYAEPEAANGVIRITTRK